MRCVVFGGGGFIGSAIVDRLLQDGHVVRVFERPRVTPFRQFGVHEPLEWVTGDTLSTHDVRDAVQGMDAVVHLVSSTLPKNSNDDPVFDVQSNLVATLGLLEAMRECAVARIVFISSGGTVYGRPLRTPIDESHPTDPLVSYGIVKLAIEKYLLMYERLRGIKPVILRVANPYGERQRVETAQGAVAAFLYRALKGDTVEIWGDGSIVRDYIYVGDVANAFARALSYTGPQSVFNVSSGVGTSLEELLAALERSLDRPIARVYLPGRPFDVSVSVLDNTRARAELGWSPQVDLGDGIRRTVAWMTGRSAD